jgi:hypothetical protein
MYPNIYLSDKMYASEESSRGKQVYVADSKNEMIKFAILIALHIVQY